MPVNITKPCWGRTRGADVENDTWVPITENNTPPYNDTHPWLYAPFITVKSSGAWSADTGEESPEDIVEIADFPDLDPHNTPEDQWPPLTRKPEEKNVKKTSREWMEELPEPYRSQAIANLKGNQEVTYEDVCDALISAFTWGKTPQGEYYWKNLHKKLEKGETINHPEPQNNDVPRSQSGDMAYNQSHSTGDMQFSVMFLGTSTSENQRKLTQLIDALKSVDWTDGC